MTIGVVHATSYNATSPTIASTGGPNHSLVVVISSFNPSSEPSISGVTLGGSPLTQAEEVINSGSGYQTSWIYYKSGIASGQTALVVGASNLPVDSGSGAVDVIELDCPIVLDAQNNDQGFSTSMMTGSTGTLSAAEEIAIGGFCAGTPTDTAGWTNIESGTWSFSAYKQVSATTALNLTADNNGTFWSGVIATFKRGIGISNPAAFMAFMD